MHTTRIQRRTLLAGLSAALLAPQALLAAPLPYRLVPEATDVRFTFLLNGQPQQGRLPVRAARIHIDPQNLARSQADITLDARRARTGLIFATEALKSPGILDTARFPEIRFRSTRIRWGRTGGCPAAHRSPAISPCAAPPGPSPCRPLSTAAPAPHRTICGNWTCICPVSSAARPLAPPDTQAWWPTGSASPSGPASGKRADPASRGAEKHRRAEIRHRFGAKRLAMPPQPVMVAPLCA